MTVMWCYGNGDSGDVSESAMHYALHTRDYAAPAHVMGLWEGV